MIMTKKHNVKSRSSRFAEHNICREFFAIFIAIERITKNRVHVFHLANEGMRSVVTGRRLSMIGLRAGAPDYIVVFADRPAIHIEVKCKSGRLSDKQKMLHDDLREAGHEIYTIRDIPELLAVIVPVIPELRKLDAVKLGAIKDCKSVEEFYLLTNSI